MIRERFRAMGTDVEFVLDADPSRRVRSVVAGARREIERGETIMSRFDPVSELSRLNQSRRLDRPSPELFVVVGLAMRGRVLTAGRFDPFVGAAVASAGYDRTFADVPSDGRIIPAAAPIPPTTVSVDADGLSLHGRGQLDLGGIAKGFLAEVAADVLSRAGSCLVNAGGDIAVRGIPRAGTRWTVSVPVPGGELTVTLPGTAVATSGQDLRTWRRGGRRMHHIVDPVTGAPARTDIPRITVFGPTAVDAETWATALFLAGSAEEAAAEADGRTIGAVIVNTDGRVLVSQSVAGLRPATEFAA